MAKNENTHWRTIMNTKFLAGDELPDEGIVVEIETYNEDSFFSPRSHKEEEHIVIRFKGFKKPMILTNRKAKQIHKALSTPYMDEWEGKSVLLYPVNEKHFGEYFKVINIKEAKAKEKPELTPEHPNWEKAKKSIKDGKTDIKNIRKHYKVSEVNRLKLEKDE
jgi:hypothetical protein